MGDSGYSAGMCVCVCVSNASKEPRRFPPDLVELEAIQQNSTRVFHKVHFPNETNQVWQKGSCWAFSLNIPTWAWDHEHAGAAASARFLQIFEVTSTTTIRELCRSIASQLKVSSADGYGLYLKTRKKARLRFPPPRAARDSDFNVAALCFLR